MTETMNLSTWMEASTIEGKRGNNDWQFFSSEKLFREKFNFQKLKGHKSRKRICVQITKTTERLRLRERFRYLYCANLMCFHIVLRLIAIVFSYMRFQPLCV